MVRIPLTLRVAACAVFMATTSIPAVSQAVSLEAYSHVLDQIADKKLSIAQRELFIKQQNDEMNFLREQISSVGPVSGGIDELVDKMAAQTEDAINSDIPFKLDERIARMQKLKADIADENLPVGTKYRRALSALSIEVNYGFDIESYAGERPLNDGEQPIIVSTLDIKGDELLDENTGEVVMEPEQGDYLRYGRMALVFLNQRATSARRYDVPSSTWVDVKGDELLEIRRAVRVSKGQSAPAVLMAPVYKSE